MLLLYFGMSLELFFNFFILEIFGLVFKSHIIRAAIKLLNVSFIILRLKSTFSGGHIPVF